jgi:hypothetical protein
MRRLGAIMVAAALLLSLSAHAADAALTTSGSWRRWPWRNGYQRTLTQVGGHSYASASARKAIDIAMTNEGVYSIGPGTVVTVSSDAGAGTYVQVRVDDGSVVTYEHLSRADTAIGTTLWMGDRIAVSGATGNVTGPHLHLQRSESTSFSSDAMELTPIDGNRDPVEGGSYRSENAGIGTDVGARTDRAMRTAYSRYGGWAGVGVPQSLVPARTPCWSRGQAPTRWMFRCAGGAVQTYEKGTADHVLLSKGGASFEVVDRIHLALVAMLDGEEVLARVGFPTADVVTTSRLVAQMFERGRISHEPGSCRVKVTQDGVSRQITVC